MNVTLYQNGPASLGGVPYNFACAEIDMQGAKDAGYWSPYWGNYSAGTVTDTAGRDIPIMTAFGLTPDAGDSGLLAFMSNSSFASATDIVPPCPPPIQTAGGYEQTGFAAINTAPADWALHCRDYYYSKQEELGTQDGDLTYYSGVFTGNAAPSWDAGQAPYYKNETLRRLYWTANDNFFGAWRGLFYDNVLDHLTFCAGAAHGNGNGVQSAGNLERSWSDARINGVSGSFANLCNDYMGGTMSYGTGYNGNAGPGSSDSTRLIMIHFTDNDTEYIGIATILTGPDGLPLRGNFIAWGLDFFSSAPEPGTEGDWGATTGGIMPGAQSQWQANITVSPISGALQRTSWGGVGKGLTAWIMTAAEYGALNEAIWNKNFLDRILKFGRNPGDGILSVHQVPRVYTKVQNTLQYVSSYGISLGFYSSEPTQRIYIKDFGSVNVPDIVGSAPAYDATCEIYLPFCGCYTLDIKKVMRGTLSLEYRIDILTGDCVAVVSVATAYPPGVEYDGVNSVLLTAQGNCAVQVPFAYTDGGVQARLSVLSGMITAAMSAGTGNAGGVIAGALSVANINKEQISTSSSSGNAGSFSQLKPFVWVKYPVPLNAGNLGTAAGRVSGWGGTVGTGADGSISGVEPRGFAQYAAVDVRGIPCTKEEAEEIETLLKGGIHFDDP